MTCTLNQQANYVDWKKSDSLVKGWIFGSVCENVMATIVGLQTANDVWMKLKNAYKTPTAPNNFSSALEDFEKYIPLCIAIHRGDWDATRKLVESDESMLSVKLNNFGHTTLHIAVGTDHENLLIVENLLKKMNPKLLPFLVDDVGMNPAHIAARVGNIAAAKMLVKENSLVLFVADKNGCCPIVTATNVSRKSTFHYFLKVTKRDIELSREEGCQNPFEGTNGALFLNEVIYEGFIDEALDFVKEKPDMARATYEERRPPLANLAGKQDLYYSGAQYNFYQKLVYSFVPIDSCINLDKVRDIEKQDTYSDKVLIKCKWSFFHAVIRGVYAKLWKFTLLHVNHINQLKEDKLKHNKVLMLLKCICEEVNKPNRKGDVRGHSSRAMYLASKHNTPEAIEEIANQNPHTAWLNIDGLSIIHIAIVNRNEKVYNMIVHQLNINKNLVRAYRDKDYNNLLHSAGHLAPIHKLNVVSGAALQMQRELQWFKEVEKFVTLEYRDARNINRETPMMIFRKEHKELRKEGEEWMKKTADSYTITAALILTIVFAAAITVPGGNNGETGKPFFDKKLSFIIFAISDAISLFASTTTLLLFQSVLTARYRDEDFLYRLPKRLILGLVMLFLSVTFLMVAFSVTLYVIVGPEITTEVL